MVGIYIGAILPVMDDAFSKLMYKELKETISVGYSIQAKMSS